MKRNMLSIIILALLVVNLGMNAFLLLSVMSTNQKTAKLISDISAALSLESEEATMAVAGNGGNVTVDAADAAYYDIAGDDQMTIPLKLGEDGTQHYAVVGITLAMNTKNEDYETYGATESLDARKGIIKSDVQTIIGQYTVEECQLYQADIAQEILEQIQSEYGGSQFIYDVRFSTFLLS